jgi:hypothetical protein
MRYEEIFKQITPQVITEMNLAAKAISQYSSQYDAISKALQFYQKYDMTTVLNSASKALLNISTIPLTQDKINASRHESVISLKK